MKHGLLHSIFPFLRKFSCCYQLSFYLCFHSITHEKRGTRQNAKRKSAEPPTQKKNQIDQKWGGDSGRCIGILGDFQVGGANMPMCVWSLSLCTFMYSECRAFMYWLYFSVCGCDEMLTTTTKTRWGPCVRLW